MDEEFEDYSFGVDFGAILYHYPEDFREDSLPPFMVAYFTEPKYLKRWLEDNDIIISKEESECIHSINAKLPKDWYVERTVFSTNTGPLYANPEFTGPTMNKNGDYELFIDGSNISPSEKLEIFETMNAMLEASEELNKFQGDNI